MGKRVAERPPDSQVADQTTPKAFRWLARVMTSPPLLVIAGGALMALTVMLTAKEPPDPLSWRGVARTASGFFAGAAMLLLGVARRGEGRGKSMWLRGVGQACGVVALGSYLIDLLGPLLG